MNPCIVAVTFAGTFKAAMLVPRICGRYNNVSAGRHVRRLPSEFRQGYLLIAARSGMSLCRDRSNRGWLPAPVPALIRSPPPRADGGRRPDAGIEDHIGSTFAVTVLVGVLAAVMLFVP